MTHFIHRAGSQRGSSLLEVLIAVLVLAIGMLGLAALAAVTIKNSNSSAARSQATVHIYSLFDSLRLERERAINGDFDTGWTSDTGSGELFFQEWLTNVQTTLGDSGAEGQVVCDASSCTVGVRWLDTPGEAEQQLETSAGDVARLEVTMSSRL